MSQTKAQLIDPVDGTIVNADINASAAIAGSKISPDFGSQTVTTTGVLNSANITITSATPAIVFSENDANPDFQISQGGGVLRIEDVTNGYATRLAVNSDGHVDVIGNLDVGAGLDVTGGGLTVNTGTTNTCATFTSTDSGAVINITDNSARSSIEQNGTDLKIISDTDAGDADSTIKFLVDNSTKVTIDSSGRFLIGTTTEGQANADNLTIDGGDAETGITIRSGTSRGNHIYFSDGTSGDDEYRGIISYQHSDNKMQFFTNASERMRIDSSGNVGIGTTSPDHVLDLGSSTSGRALTFSSYSNLFSEYSSGALWISSNFYGNSGSSGYKTGVTGNFGAAGIKVNATGGSSSSGIIQFFTDDNASKTAGNAFTPTERMRIDEAGNVGINESSPSSELVVKANDSNESAIQILAGGNGKESQLFFAAPDDADVGSIKYDHNGDVMKFTVATGERMRFTSSGNLFHGRTSAITSNSVNTSNNIEQIDSFTWTLGLHADQAHKIGMTILYSSTNNNHDFFRCQVSGSGGRFVVEGDGDCFNQNGTFSSISDESLKENIVDAKSQWNDIKNLKVRNYNFKESTGRPTHTQIGLVAQELETVCPNLVKETEEGLKTVANSVLYMKAIKALQEAMAKIETLEVEVAALKAA